MSSVVWMRICFTSSAESGNGAGVPSSRGYGVNMPRSMALRAADTISPAMPALLPVASDEQLDDGTATAMCAL